MVIECQWLSCDQPQENPFHNPFQEKKGVSSGLDKRFRKILSEDGDLEQNKFNFVLREIEIKRESLKLFKNSVWCRKNPEKPDKSSKETIIE